MMMESHDQMEMKGKIETTVLHPKEEIREWMSVNRKLRKHGLDSVRIFPADDIDVRTGHYVCLDTESSENLRNSLSAVLTELDRKENMVQNILQSSDSLQSEMDQLRSEAYSSKTKAKDLKVMLECSRARVQELEEDKSKTSVILDDDDERAKNLKSAMTSKIRTLEARLKEQEKENVRLKRELIAFAEEEDHRTKRQNQIFVDFKKRTSRAHSVMDHKLLDIIDSYENQIDALEQQLRSLRENLNENSSTGLPNRSANSFKGVFKSYEKQLKEKDRQIKLMETEIQSQDTRVELKDYRLQALRVKKLEKLLAQNHISVPGERTQKDLIVSRKKFSTKLEDLEYLPLDNCHQFLKEICEELETDNIVCTTDIIRELKNEVSNSGRFQEYCKELAEIVNTVSLKTGAHRRMRNDKEASLALTDVNMKYYLEVLENWRKDIGALGELQESLNLLLAESVPWIRAYMDRDHSVPEMVELLERVIHANKTDAKKSVLDEISRTTLEGIVSHFQTLFEVPKISGIFPKMNQVYSRLGETTNVTNTLKSLMGLPANTHSSALVDAVGRLCHNHNLTTSSQLKKLMQTDDLNGVLRRLEEHKEFFPAFQGIMFKLFEILGVDSMNEVLPAVRALKLLSQKSQ